jgi:drug/metabolite transporter (DMT)-like permease
MNKRLLGHIFSFITITIWSVAFVSNKALLNYITPIENMLLRFIIALSLLILIYPKELIPKSFKDELSFAFIGFLGIFLYFILENFALKYTQATNVGLYMGAIPILTAITAHIFSKDEKLSKYLIIGFFIAMVGIAAILLEGAKFEIRLKGDLLALLAALTFSLYSISLKLAPKDYHYIAVTRKSFFYGILFMLIYYLFSNQPPFHWKELKNSVVWLNILYLGILSSGLAFILWQQGIEKIGSINASNYIYLVPLITAITGVVFLNEIITPTMIIGGVLIITGLYISQKS